MADFSIRSDSVNVEQVMEQIRSRIREKRGVDYTEQEIRELAAVKLEKFLDPQSVRSTLIEEFRRRPPSEPAPHYAFEADTMFASHRPLLRFIRRALRPILKLFFNPNPLIQALHIQATLNAQNEERVRAEADRHALSYELMHNLVLEATRLGIEVKNLKMRVESLASRVDFNERRARALESVVVYKPSEEPVEAAGAAAIPAEPPPADQTPEGPGQKSRRRRRRRGRRGGSSAAAAIGAPAPADMAASGDAARGTPSAAGPRSGPAVEPPPAPAPTETLRPLPEPPDRSATGRARDVPDESSRGTAGPGWSDDGQ